MQGVGLLLGDVLASVPELELEVFGHFHVLYKPVVFVLVIAAGLLTGEEKEAISGDMLALYNSCKGFS